MARKISCNRLLNSLKDGELKGAMQYVAENKNGLSLQIRKDYLNIYYRGGNILKISGINSFHFDENYFYKDKSGDRVKKKKELVDIFREKKFEKYFEKAKKVIDDWLEKYPKPEREEQHNLIMKNNDKNSDFVIIDIEFAVSRKAKYKYDGKQPRFDIIAIRKSDSMLCIIELKKGIKALGGNSGIKGHFDDFNNSIGENPLPFIDEVRELLQQKQDFGLLDFQLKISEECKKPIFMFAFSYQTDNERQTFDNCKNEVCEALKTLYLPNGELILKEPI